MSLETFNPQTGQGLDDDGFESTPADGGQFNALGAGAVPVRKKRLSDTTIVLLATVIVGIAILVGMRWLGTRASIFRVDAGVEKTVNEFLTKLTGQRSAAQRRPGLTDPDAVMNTLTVDRTESQVPLSMVKRNPFLRVVRHSEENGMTAIDPAKQREEQRLAKLRIDLEKRVARMRLSSIMGKAGNRVAVLDNLVVQEGDVVDDTFEIIQINELDIVIRAEGFEFRKSLAQ